MTIYHWHHIVPKHMGGTDDQSNLVYLTVEEHAEAHRLLYEEYGKKEDYVAWQGLSGMIGRQKIISESQKMGYENAIKNGMLDKSKEKLKEMRENNPEWWNSVIEKRKKSISEYWKNNPGSFTGKSHSDLSKQKIGEKNSKHQKGNLNSQFGTKWIYSLEEKISKKIPKNDPIPEGWFKGRKLKF